MPTEGHKTALELALEAWREVQEERRAVQGDLFEDFAGRLPGVVGSEVAAESGSEAIEVVILCQHADHAYPGSKQSESCRMWP